MTVKPAKITIEQWHKIIDSGAFDRANVQLIAGEIVEMPPENPIHSGTIMSLSERLKRLFSNKAVIISQGHPLALDNSEPEPDIAILQYRDEYYKDRHPIANEVYLAIEIANTSLEFDKSNKKEIYANAGIIEYWIVDLGNKKLIVHRDPLASNYNSIASFTTGTIALVAFPEISITIDKIF